MHVTPALTGLGSPEELAACSEYNAVNALTVTDGNGHTTTHTYDANGRRSSTTDALGNVKRYEYQDGGRPKSITDAIGTVM